MTKFYTGTLILFFAFASAQARWSPVSSGTPNDLQSAQHLDSGVGPTLGDGGTILKTPDLGARWPKGPLTTRSFRAKRSAAEESRGVSFEVSPRDPSIPPPAALGMTLLFSGRPLSGGAGIECRLASGNYPTLVFTFGAPLTSVAAVGETTCERLGAIRIDSQDAHRVLADHLSDNSNFCEDLNADGRIDRNDARLVRRENGSALLP